MIIIKLAKKTDIFIIGGALILALIVSAVLWLKPFEGDLYACVYLDGEFVEAVKLQEEYNEVEIKTQYGINILVVLGEMAFISESDCAYEQCVNKGGITRPNQSTVCAPHGLLITIEDERSVEGKR